MTKEIWSYPKVYALGHPAIAELLEGPTVVEEKLDGSQFSFAVLEGELFMRSKNAMVYEQSAGMFEPAVSTVTRLHARGLIRPDLVYRCEFLSKPKHNTLAYGRIPLGSLALFDLEKGPSSFLSPTEKDAEAERLEIDVVPRFSPMALDRVEVLDELLGEESFLGGPKIEGIVVKNYTRFGVDGKILAGKYVSESFKESHERAWKKANPGRGDLIEELIAANRTEARWEKAVQHLRERGELEGADRDIGAIIREVQRDVEEECAEVIRGQLWKWAAPKIKRGVAGGVAEWYKRRLLERQFAQ